MILLNKYTLLKSENRRKYIFRRYPFIHRQNFSFWKLLLSPEHVMEIPCHNQLFIFLVSESGQESDAWAVMSQDAPLCSLETQRILLEKAFLGKFFLFSLQTWTKQNSRRLHCPPAHVSQMTQPVAGTTQKLLCKLWVMSLLASGILWSHYELCSSPHQLITYIETRAPAEILSTPTPWPLSLPRLQPIICK